jgi:hypothetical protein
MGSVMGAHDDFVKTMLELLRQDDIRQRALNELYESEFGPNPGVTLKVNRKGLNDLHGQAPPV